MQFILIISTKQNGYHDDACLYGLVGQVMKRHMLDGSVVLPTSGSRTYTTQFNNETITVSRLDNGGLYISVYFMLGSIFDGYAMHKICTMCKFYALHVM